MPHYREATAKDLAAICLIGEEVNVLHHQAWPHIFVKSSDPMQHSAHWSKSIEKENATTFVAEKGQQLVGFITVSLVQDERTLVHAEPYGSIGSVVVTSSSRGMGIGRGLMQCAERWAMQRKAKDIRLTVYQFNQNALDLYRELGYEIRSHNMGKRLL